MAVPIERGEVLQNVGVADAVVGVDAKAEGDHQPLRDLDTRNGAQAAHVFLGSAQPRVVAAHEDVGAAGPAVSGPTTATLGASHSLQSLRSANERLAR